METPYNESVAIDESGELTATVAVLPLGPASLVVGRVGDGGLVVCGAIDPARLAAFGLAVARVRPTSGPSIGSGADLLAGEVVDANELATGRGVVAGLTGAQALRALAG